MCGIVNNSREQTNKLSIRKRKDQKSEISHIGDSKPNTVVLDISKHITRHRW